MTERRYFSGNSLEQVVMNAARHFKLDPDDLEYRQMDKRHGFVKTRHNVVIEVDPDRPRKPLSDEEAYRRAMQMDPEAHLGRDPNDRSYVTDGPGAGKKRSRRRTRRSRGPRRSNGGGDRPDQDRSAGAAEQPSAAPSREQRGRRRRPRRREKATGTGNLRATKGSEMPAEDRGNGDGEAADSERDRHAESRRRVKVATARSSRPRAEGPAADAAIEGIQSLLRLGRLDLESAAYQGEDRLEIELSGHDEHRVTRHRGEVLTALQQLVPTLVRSETGDRVFCRVDCDGFREIHEEQLRDLAQRVAEKVGRSRRAQVLESMNPAERRIIHMTLADDPAVSTESLGNGYFKRIRVAPD